MGKKLDLDNNQTQPSSTKEKHNNATPTPSSSHQYGGTHTATWINHLPRSWTPYIQLSRLSPPAALFLIFLPHFYGVMHAARTTDQDISSVFRSCGILFCGSFFYSNAAHAWNDLVDAPIDRQVSRTKNRPIARGAITPRAALIFTLSQAIGAACFLIPLPRRTAVMAVPSILGAAYYPWAKLHTYFPQLVLGACLAWGAMVGASTLGIEEPDRAEICLVMSLILWTSIYDTVYAHQDKKDDMKIGVKSTAVLFQHHARKLLWGLLLFMGICLLYYGWLTEAGWGYYSVSLGASVGSLGSMIYCVDLDDEASCWWWFSKGFWFTGVSLSLGLVVEYGMAAYFGV
ncbi:prenyltransferase [Poronia punctata]|nr:prenyltransferase [Poronia punctata]